MAKMNRKKELEANILIFMLVISLFLFVLHDIQREKEIEKEIEEAFELGVDSGQQMILQRIDYKFIEGGIEYKIKQK